MQAITLDAGLVPRGVRDSTGIPKRYVMLVISDYYRTRVLLWHRHGEYAVPYLEIGMDDLILTSNIADRSRDFELYWNLVEHLERSASRKLGFSVTVRRCLSANLDEPDAPLLAVYELEPADMLVVLDGHWITERDLWKIRLSLPAHHRLLRSWFQLQTELEKSPIRVPEWYRPQWIVEAREWIARQLFSLGHTAGIRITQSRTWANACLLRAQSTKGKWYFKACPQFANQEIILYKRLYERWPSLIPPVVAIEKDRHWLLLEDQETHTLREHLRQAYGRRS